MSLWSPVEASGLDQLCSDYVSGASDTLIPEQSIAVESVPSGRSHLPRSLSPLQVRTCHPPGWFTPRRRENRFQKVTIQVLWVAIRTAVPSSCRPASSRARGGADASRDDLSVSW